MQSASNSTVPPRKMGTAIFITAMFAILSLFGQAGLSQEDRFGWWVTAWWCIFGSLAYMLIMWKNKRYWIVPIVAVVGAFAVPFFSSTFFWVRDSWPLSVYLLSFPDLMARMIPEFTLFAVILFFVILPSGLQKNLFE